MAIEYVVSACLAGCFCKYNGGSNPCPEVIGLCRRGLALPLCPEQLSGLPVPRPPCEQLGGRVISRTGEDWTAQMEKGAELALRQALALPARRAILKSHSPSCGFGQIYDGHFCRKLIAGNGIFAAKLLRAGFAIFTELDLPADLSRQPTGPGL